MLQKPYLMVPGPTAVPERVLQAMHRPVINHRGPQYEALFRDVSDRLKTVFKTKQDVLTYPSAGTGMMEAAVVNILSPGDHVLVVSIGVFGDRFAEIAAKFGAVVEKLDFPWGEAADPQVLAERLAGDKEGRIKAVFLTHNETSTGVTNDVRALAAACKGHPALVVVDAVSSLGAVDLAMDEWGLDVVITGAQKALMLPPGLGFMALSERAWAACAQSTMPKFYWDAQAVKKALAKGQNPYTPPVSLLFGLAEALRLIEEEGLDNIFARHRLLATALRAGVRAMGLGLLADDKVASPGVTAVLPPAGIEAKKIQKTMRERFGITLAGGQKKLENQIFRIGHLGYVAETDILVTLATLEMTLTLLGHKVELGAGVRAAQIVILEG
ncbi:pyridoxal-phosphate-dependent aminotransferase family protein [Sporolituus thermophilus]|uniref:Aspartate aminotransferase n=1 Tax=Sporolituus thermophilus DSM 23256 TaxID=1123285 RepID=A0A1G7HSU0_9FIRM|nr:alanine--glyoxylate aminotransferase family protein [Sporolituus thermophilus]SDF03408.1 aspartate aminotransferase [Sporolituus thermophilus DSM 23256]